MKINKISQFLILLSGGAVLLGGCGRDLTSTGIEYAPEMYHSIPLEPYTQVKDSLSPFADGRNAQLPPVGTIARNHSAAYPFEQADTAGPKGLVNPISLTKAHLEEGDVLYQRYCGVCHGKAGAGDGKVAENEAINPPNLVTDPRVSALTSGQLYHVLMTGKGVMGSYASQTIPDERWKIIHFIEELQGKHKSATVATPTAVADTGKPAVAPVNAPVNHQ